MGIGSSPIFSGEICSFFGTGQCVARLHFHDNGMGVYPENEVGQGGDREVPLRVESAISDP